MEIKLIISMIFQFKNPDTNHQGSFQTLSDLSKSTESQEGWGWKNSQEISCHSSPGQSRVT